MMIGSPISKDHEAHTGLTPTDKALWVAALRSGNYRQIRATLTNGHGGYCCLGVLCKVKNILFNQGRGYCQASYDAIADLIPNYWSLVQLNDGGKTFPQIADWIEANL